MIFKQNTSEDTTQINLPLTKIVKVVVADKTSVTWFLNVWRSKSTLEKKKRSASTSGDINTTKLYKFSVI